MKKKTCTTCGRKRWVKMNMDVENPHQLRCKSCLKKDGLLPKARKPRIEAPHFRLKRASKKKPDGTKKKGKKGDKD